MLMEPFGQGNKKPQFLSESVIIQKIAYLGADQQHLKIWIADSKDSSRSLELITFNYKNNLEIFTDGNEQVVDEKQVLDKEQIMGEEQAVGKTQTVDREQVVGKEQITTKKSIIGKKQEGRLQPGNKINIVYTLEENIWNGHRSIQGRIVDLEVAG